MCELKVRILDENLKIRNKKEIILDSKFTGNYNNVKNVHSKIVFTPPQRFHVCHYCNKLMKINNSTNNMQNTKHFCGHVCCIDCSKTVSTSKLITIGVPNACPICEGLCDCKTCVKQGNENIQLKTIKKDQHCFACGKDIQPTTNKYIQNVESKFILVVHGMNWIRTLFSRYNWNGYGWESMFNCI